MPTCEELQAMNTAQVEALCPYMKRGAYDSDYGCLLGQTILHGKEFQLTSFGTAWGGCIWPCSIPQRMKDNGSPGDPLTDKYFRDRIRRALRERIRNSYELGERYDADYNYEKAFEEFVRLQKMRDSTNWKKQAEYALLYAVRISLPAEEAIRLKETYLSEEVKAI